MAKKSKKQHAKAGARALGKGLMGMGTVLAKRASVAGAIGEYLEDYAYAHNETAQTKWWAGPAAIMAAALVAGGASGLMKANESAAKGLAGAAGHAAAFNYKLHKFQNGKGDSPLKNRNFVDTKDEDKKAPAGAQGYEETGMRSDADTGLFN